jgi:hypothetical protein
VVSDQKKMAEAAPIYGGHRPLYIAGRCKAPFINFGRGRDI